MPVARLFPRNHNAIALVAGKAHVVSCNRGEAMSIVIERADRISFEAAGHGDFSFMVEAYALPEFDKPVAHWEKIPVAPYSKDYDDTGKEDAFGDETALFIAKAGGRMALSHSWNRYALLDTIGVARNFRGQGIGHALLEQAIAWARTKGMPGLMLETQNNNLAACLLYEKHGFRLGGIDRFFYRGIDPRSREIALFWYLDFNGSRLHPAA